MRKPSFRFGLGAVWLAVLLAAGGSARAEDADEATVRARALFGEGVTLVEQGELARAEALFREALELRDAPTIRYNLAATLVRLDRPVEAAELSESVLADPEAPDDIRARAEELLGEVRERVARIEIDSSAFEGELVVALDGVELQGDWLGRALLVEPGDHVVTATRGGEAVARSEVTVAAGEAARVRLQPIPTELDQAIAGGAAQPDRPAPAPLVRDWRLWVGVGVGAAIVLTGVVVGIAVGVGGGVEDPVVGTMDPGVLTWR